MTWYDIKLATLQKLFSADGDTLVNDETTRDYLAAMPQAANEALQLIVTRISTCAKALCLTLQAVSRAHTMPGMTCMIWLLIFTVLEHLKSMR